MEQPDQESAQRKIKHPIPWLNTLVTQPFYSAHALAIFSYLVLRQASAPWISSDFSYRLFRRELQAFLTFAVIASIKISKSETWESFFADMTLYTKGFLIMLAFLLDRQLALWYIVIFIVMYLLFPQPPCNEMGNVQHLTPLQLESILTNGSSSQAWLVEFRATWSSRCIQSTRIMSELSMVYSNENLQLGVVDLGCFPNAAAKFGISLSVNTGQIPTFVLFKNGAEVTRMPEADLEAKAISPTKITRAALVRRFELDRFFVEYLSNSS